MIPESRVCLREKKNKIKHNQGGISTLVPMSLKAFRWFEGAGGGWRLSGMNPAHADTLRIFVSPSVITLRKVTCHYYPCGILGLQALVHFPG